MNKEWAEARVARETEGRQARGYAVNRACAGARVRSEALC